MFVRIGRIELPFHPWQGRVLPLNYTRLVELVYQKKGLFSNKLKK